MKNWKFLPVLLPLLIIFTSNIFAQKQSPSNVPTFKNPVIAGDFADPSVILVGDTYYACGTSSEWGPAYPVYSSKNLIDWQYVGPVFAELPEWTMGSFWAPELYFRNGTFFVYYTARRKSDKKSYIGVATTKDLKKGFQDHGVIIEWTNEAIDAFVVEDAGKLVITWKAYGLDKDRGIEILGAELSPDGLKVTGKEFSMIKADAGGWEAGGAEGQAIFKRGNYWYMLYSGNACCGNKCDYQVGMARAENLTGPWTKFSGNPILFSNENWKCPGHGTVVITPENRYFYLHHAYDGTDFTFTGRQGMLSELVWDETSKWPAFRYGKTLPARAEAPLNASVQAHSKLDVTFDKEHVKVPWVYDVSFPKPAFSDQNGDLKIENSNRIPAGNFLGLTVKNGNYTFTTDVQINPNLMQSIVVYGDANNAVGYGVRNNEIRLWQVKEGVFNVIETHKIAAEQKQIRLKLVSKNGSQYEFSYETTGQKSNSQTSSVLTENAWLPRWDRAPRVGVNVSGDQAGKSEISAVQMKYD